MQNIHLLAITSLCSFSLGLGLPGQVSPELAELIKKEGLENSRVMGYLDTLTNSIGHRLTGSDNFTRACNWTREEFEKMGLTAKLEKWGEWKVVWNRGQWQGRVVKPVEMDLQVATEAWTPGTKGRVRAEVVRMPTSVGDIEAAKKGLAGKWVLARRRPRANVQRALVAAGVAGLLYSSRGDGKYPNRIRVFGKFRRPERDLVQVAIRRDQFRKMWELVDEEEEKMVAEFDIRNRFRDEKIALHNVVADIVGTEKPDEYVIVCGHLDSWHQATGTTDNGTGTTSTMEAARILAAVGAKPRRTIRFILWGGEEQGLIGSRGYVMRHRQEMNNVSAVFNHDTGTNWAHSLRVTRGMFDDMQKVLAPVMTMTAPDDDADVFKLGKVRRMGGGRGGGGSDHASFLAAGVPAFSWGLTGRSNYFSYTWHSQWDTFDAAIPEYQRHTSTVIALTALGVANLPHLLSRDGVDRNRPRSDAKPIVEARLGVELEGLKIVAVDANSMAAAAGFKNGDVIVSVNDGKISGAVDVNAAMRDKSAPWTFTVQRGGKLVGLLVEEGAEKGVKKSSKTGKTKRQ